MTNINKNNIEKWLFDYHEGNLTQEDRETLEKFILLNPEYEAEMDAWSMAFVENEEFEYDNSDSLYQKKRRIGWIGWSSAAVILISGIALSFLFLNQSSSENLQFTFTLDSQDEQSVSTTLTNSSLNVNSSKFSDSNANSDALPKNSDEVSPNNLASNSNRNDNISDAAISVNMMPAKKAGINNSSRVDTKTYIKSENKNVITHSTVKPNEQATNQKKIITTKANKDFTNKNANISNGQNHVVADHIIKPEFKDEIHEKEELNDELISAIPGKSEPLLIQNEFAHLEPVEPKLEKDVTLYQALDKLDYDANTHAGTYNSNPDYSDNKIDLTENLKGASRRTSTKFIRNLKRAFNNPSGVTNLRDPNLVIPGFNPVAFNPALTGGMLKTRIQTSYMNQWTGTSQMQHIAQLSVDSYVYGMRGGIGMHVQFRDFAQGMYRNYDASLTYSPKINFGKFLTIEPAIKFNAGAYTLDASKIQAGGQIEMERGNIYQTFESGENPIGTRKIYYDLGVGLFVNTKWFYGGFSMDNIFRHKENIFSNDISNPRRAPHRINAVIGTDFESRNKNFSGSPFIVYQHYDNYDEFYFGSNFRFYWGTAGVSISDKGSISAQAGIQFRKFKMLYQYDWTKSKVMGNRGHSHELMFRFTIKPKRSLTKNLEY